MTDSKLIPFAPPAEHKRVWYTWGPVLGRYEPLGVELLRDTKTGNWFIVTPHRSSTIPAFVAGLATCEDTPDLIEQRVLGFMEWLMGMLKRHA